MAVVKHDVIVSFSQSFELGLERGVVRCKPTSLAAFNLGSLGTLAARVDCLAVERNGWTKFGGCLAGVERLAGGIAIDVDHRPRDCRANDRCIERARRLI